MSQPNVQDGFYTEAVDYAHGSPHLSHTRLFRRLSGIVLDELEAIRNQGLPLTVLEVGAGHGGYTQPVLDAGATVSAVEMASASVVRLQHRFKNSDKFRVIHSPDGSLSAVEGSFSLVLAVSVLHHIPDYVSFLAEMAEKVSPHGSLITLQDPLWYRRHAVAHRMDQACYLLWRARQGDLGAGLATRMRRARGRLDESNPRDMVEYHVVRQGCDELEIAKALAPKFASITTEQYWSNQSSIAQRVGELVGLVNTFGVIARDRR